MDEKVLYLAYKGRGYRIKVAGAATARIERQAHGGFEAASQKAYTYPYILEGVYWDYTWCSRLIDRYEKDLKRELERDRLKAIEKAEPGIREVIIKLIKSKSDIYESEFETGYEIARELKALGYILEQVTPVAARLCRPNVRAGIQIEYTGLYD